jgi:hypothetical protein
MVSICVQRFEKLKTCTGQIRWRFKRKKTTGKKNGGTCNYQSQIQQDPIVIETYRFLKDVGFRGSNAECLTQSPAILQAVEAEQKQ